MKKNILFLLLIFNLIPIIKNGNLALMDPFSLLAQTNLAKEFNDCTFSKLVDESGNSWYTDDGNEMYVAMKDGNIPYDDNGYAPVVDSYGNVVPNKAYTDQGVLINIPDYYSFQGYDPSNGSDPYDDSYVDPGDDPGTGDPGTGDPGTGDPGTGGGGGGGGGGGSGSHPVIFYVNECDPNNTNAGVAATNLLNDPSVSPQTQILFHDMYTNPSSPEENFLIGNKLWGVTYVGPIQIGTDQYHSSIKYPDPSSGVSPIAVVHIHLHNTPPSAKDLITIAQAVALHPTFKGIYAITANGCTYYLGIADANKLAAFLAKYGSDVDPSGDWKSGSFPSFESTVAYYNFYSQNPSHTSTDPVILAKAIQDSQADALAAILNFFDVGAVLYSMEAGVLKANNSRINSTNSHVTYTSSKCN